MNLRNMDGNKKTGNKWVEIGMLILICGLFSAFSIWQAASAGWRITVGGDIFPKAFIKSGGSFGITYLNQESIYLSLLSVLFSFLGNKETVVSVVNFIVQLVGIFFFYAGAKRLFSDAFPLVFAIICSLLCGRFYPVMEDSPMHFIWCLSGIVFGIGTLTFGKIKGDWIKKIFLGVLLGVCCYVDLAGLFLLVAFLIILLSEKDVYGKDKRSKILSFVCYLVSAVSGFCVMFYLWNNFRFNSEVFQYWLNDKLSCFGTRNGLNQYSCLGVILLLIALFHVLKRSEAKGECISEETFVLDKIVQEESNGNESGLEEIIIEDTEAKETVIETKIESALQPEESKPIKFIENPLPLPKKHVKKEMNYAFEPTEDQMHYDYNNYTLDDDYDLKDI